MSIIWHTSKFIRTLDISSVELYLFPNELLQQVHLRYPELRFRSGNPPESISHLIELQTRTSRLIKDEYGCSKEYVGDDKLKASLHQIR